MKIAFLSPYPNNTVGSQRFRFEQYFVSLQSEGFEIRQHSLYTASEYMRIREGKYVQILIKAFFRRVIHLFRSSSADFVFVHRELFPIGPPIFEWILTKILRKKLIYDFDDAIWLTDQPKEHRIVRIVRNRSKIRKIISWSHSVTVGNEYLASFAKQFNIRTQVIPTTINTDQLVEKVHPGRESKTITIGWTGTHSTLKYLDDFIPAYVELSARFKVRLLIIADKNPDYNSINTEFLMWNRETEISDLMQIDIGIMPMPDDPWTRGKCGFKALQFMALGIPIVASPVGVNTKIIEDGQNGFLAMNKNQWINKISKLIDSPNWRNSLGEKGKQTVIESFNTASQKDAYVDLFKTRTT